MRTRKSSTTLASLTLLTLGSAMAIAAPTNRPTRAASPESRAGCAVPTLAQCSDPAYLERDRCGILQSKNRWTCHELLHQKMEDEKKTRGEAYSTVPKSWEKEGVGKVVRGGREPDKRYYTPDLYSYTSQKSARDYLPEGGPVIGLNKYETWEGNKNVVESCEEYAFEKFYDVSEYARRAADQRDDHWAAVQIAYGSGNDPASIGSRHLTNPLLKSRDGRGFGTLLEGTRPKSAFYAIPHHPALKGKDPVPGAPDLVFALARMNGAAPYVAKLYNGKPHTVENTWAKHRELAQSVVYVPPKNPPQKIKLGPQAEDPGDLIAGMGKIADANPAQPKPRRRRLPKELDELYDLQRRFRARWDDWARLDVRYEGSGWKITEVGQDPKLPESGGPGIGALSAGSLDPKPQNKLAPNPQPWKPPSASQDLTTEKPETVARRKVLTDMLALMDEANDEGCYEDGTTPCDWSPKLFASAVRNTFADEQDAAFETCDRFTKGSIDNAKNLHAVFVDDPDYPQFRCVIDSDTTVTAKELDDMMLKVEECREKKVLYQNAKKLDEAKARVRGIPELVDSEGNFKKPGISKSRDELMGGDKFGMGYSYDFGFTFEANQKICQLALETGGGFNTYANVFGKRFDIIDAQARFSSKSRDIKLHAKVAGKNLFTPVDIDWSKDSEVTWDLTKTVGSGKKDVPLFSTWFVIVVIPVKLEAGISGEAGINLGLEAKAEGFDNDGCPSARIAGLAEPYVGIDGYLEAGIDVFIAEVGIRGSLTIVRASLPFTAGVGVQLLGQNPGTVDPSRFELFADTKMSLKLSTLSGGISVYGEVGWCPFCVRGEKEIVSFEGPSYETDLFHQKYKVNMGDLGIALGK